MTRATLLALAARVEAAEGADRELDVGIARAAGWDTECGEHWWTPAQVAERRRLKVSRWRHQPVVLPAFTASLDAAASLLKPHQRVSVVVQHETYTAVKVWDARVAMFVGSSSASGEHAEPRARTAAALRAMAEEAGDG